MNIISQSVGGAYTPVTYTVATGTASQLFGGTTTPQLINIGGQILNGRPFKIIAQGYYKSHGASQTIKYGFQAQAGSAATFSGTQVFVSGTASGQMIAGTSYPFYAEVTCIGDSVTSEIVCYGLQLDGATPTFVAPAVGTNLTGVTFYTNNVGTNVTNPLASTDQISAQYAFTFLNSVSDTTAKITLTSFFATSD
jgi:hypothetical protein